MSISTFLPIIIISILTIIYYIYFSNKSKSALAKIDFDKEKSNYTQYKNDFLDNEFSFLKKWLKDKPIDAFTMASIPESKSDRLKRLIINGIKDFFVRIFGIKRQRIYTNCYLVLSGSDLHFFTTDIDGNYDSHSIFDSFRLDNATMTFTGPFRRDLGLINIYGNSLDKNLPQTYTITFYNIDNKNLSLEIHDRLDSSVGSIVFCINKQMERHKKNLVVGNEFIRVLKSMHPNLETHTN